MHSQWHMYYTFCYAQVHYRQQNKFKEVQAVLAPIKLEQVDIDLAEIQELDARKIIEHKLKEAFKHRKGKFIIDDSSLY